MKFAVIALLFIVSFFVMIKGAALFLEEEHPIKDHKLFFGLFAVCSVFVFVLLYKDSQNEAGVQATVAQVTQESFHECNCTQETTV